MAKFFFRLAIEESKLCDMTYLDTLDVDQLSAVYSDVITCTLDRLVPLRQVSVRHRSSDPWFDESCHEQKKLPGDLSEE